MDISLPRQIASFVGALLILVAYVGHQMGWMNSRKAGVQPPECRRLRHSCLHCLSSFSGRLRFAGSDLGFDQRVCAGKAKGK